MARVPKPALIEADDFMLARAWDDYRKRQIGTADSNVNAVYLDSLREYFDGKMA